jgi:chromosome segregation ATPase
MENVTAALQSMWHDERQQIEDSWSYKMEDFQSLQLRCKEVEHLQLEIDELSSKVVRLRVEFDESRRVLRSRRSAIASIPARLDRLYEIHPKLEEKVATLLAEKKMIDHRSQELERRRVTVEKRRAEMTQLENDVNRRSEMIEMLYAKQNAMEKPLDRVTLKGTVRSEIRHVEFPTPEDFSGTELPEEEEEEEIARFTQRSREFETMTHSSQMSTSSDNEERNDEEDLINEVISEAQEAIAMPLFRSQFWPI